MNSAGQTMWSSTTPERRTQATMNDSSKTNELTAAGGFTDDDLRFRTITALLQLLGPGLDQEPAHQQANISRTKLKVLKQLAAISFLAARSHEVVATMSKRSQTAITLLLIAPSEEGMQSHDPPVDIIVTQNPLEEPKNRSRYGKRLDDGIGPASGERQKIDLCPASQLPQLHPDLVIEHLRSNRSSLFEVHVECLATLITYAYNTNNGWVKLATYCSCQAVLKIISRYKSNKMGGYYLESLRDLNAFDSLTEFIPWSISDTQCIGFAQRKNLVDSCLFQDLYHAADDSQGYSYLNCHPDDVLVVLQQFQSFLRTVLEQTGSNLMECHKRLKKQSPVEQIKEVVNSTMHHLLILHHLAWESPFFEWYILNYQRKNLQAARDALRKAGEAEPERTAFGSFSGNSYEQWRPINRVIAGAGGKDDDEQYEDSEPGLISDPSTFPEADVLDNEVYEVGVDGGGLHEKAKSSMQWIAWLRLVTSNIHYSVLVSGKKKSRNNIRDLRMQVVRYPMSTKSMMPWRELVLSLFSEPNEGLTVCKTLLTEFGSKKSIISDPNYSFKGRIHCEAMLATLHHISRYSPENYAEIAPEVFDCVRTAMAVIAPSKRCCPVCASILRLLSENEFDYDVLGQHGNIYACALPTGMPEDIRKRLILEYEKKLGDRLRSWAMGVRRMSTESTDSKANSDHTDYLSGDISLFDDM